MTTTNDDSGPRSAPSPPEELSHAIVRPRRVAFPGTGTTGRLPVPLLLARALRHELTGTLELIGIDDGHQAMYLERGTPTRVRTAVPVAPLDEVLVGMGVLDEETLIATYERSCDENRLHGETLLRAGLIDELTLQHALALQLKEKTLSLCGLPPTTRFVFRREVNLLEDYGGEEMPLIDPRPLVVAALRRMLGHHLVDAAFGRLEERWLGLREGADLTGFDQPHERAVVAALSERPWRVGELLEEHPASERLTRLTLFALGARGCLYASSEAASGVKQRPILAPEPAPEDQRGGRSAASGLGFYHLQIG